MSELTNIKKSYMDFLPSIFRSADKETAIFVERFLKIFEKVLTGINDGVKVDDKELTGISETIDTIHKFFYPDTKYPEFIDWLSSWVGLVLKEDWSIQKKRDVIARIIPIYRMRGTKRGLEEYLNIYIDGEIKINDNFSQFQVGINSIVGESTVIGLPYFFLVEAKLAIADPQAMQRKINTIKTIIEREKPVHTDYEIQLKDVPSMQVEIHSTVGIDTLIW